MVLTACARQPVYPAPAVLNDHAVVKVEELGQGVPKFFTYQHEGRNVSFFAMKQNDKVLSFLDACASCFQHKRGYRYDDAVVTCRYCNMEFPVQRLEKGLGSCYPIRIQGRVEGGRYLIPLAVLAAAADKF